VSAAPPQKLLPRWFAPLMTATHASWYWIAPAIQEKSVRTAWLPALLFPTLLIGLVIGITFIVWPSRGLAYAFVIVLAAHIGLGFLR
jgi:FtsH-binding integral membrane protein